MEPVVRFTQPAFSPYPEKDASVCAYASNFLRFILYFHTAEGPRPYGELMTEDVS
jgi:hypothetical protein